MAESEEAAELVAKGAEGIVADLAKKSFSEAETVGADVVEDVAKDATEDVTTAAGRTLARDELSSEQLSNLTRYQKKLPAAAQDPVITRLPDGTVQFESKVPGRVPDSYALYTKVVDESGNTIKYTKTTVVPDGSVAHVKDKMA